jgi:predicted metal-dependent hydrolase
MSPEGLNAMLVSRRTKIIKIAVQLADEAQRPYRGEAWHARAVKALVHARVERSQALGEICRRVREKLAPGETLREREQRVFLALLTAAVGVEEAERLRQVAEQVAAGGAPLPVQAADRRPDR